MMQIYTAMTIKISILHKKIEKFQLNFGEKRIIMYIAYVMFNCCCCMENSDKGMFLECGHMHCNNCTQFITTLGKCPQCRSKIITNVINEREKKMSDIDNISVIMWRLYCCTEKKMMTVYSNNKPSKCPNGLSHKCIGISQI